MFTDRNPLYISHKVWCNKIGDKEAECNCDGVPSPNQQLLARSLDALVRHSKETLALMETCKQVAEACVKEKQLDKEKMNVATADSGAHAPPAPV